MDDGEEDEELDHTDIISQHGAFDDDAMEADDEEDAAAAEDVAADVDALGDAIRDGQRVCESEKEKAKFKRMLEDHYLGPSDSATLPWQRMRDMLSFMRSLQALLGVVVPRVAAAPVLPPTPRVGTPVSMYGCLFLYLVWPSCRYS
jgi:hypothetical protein